MKRNKRVTGNSTCRELLGCVSLLAIMAVTPTAQAQDATPVPDVTVTAAPTSQTPDGSASAPLMNGSAAAGYRVKDSTAAGPIWGDLPVQDTPYSISIVPAPLIENLQATTPDDLYKVIPQITNFTPSQNQSAQTSFTVRGYRINPWTNNGLGMAYDGLQGGVGGTNGITLEDKERVEMLSGVSGFLYGTGNVGGLVNYVLKRPTSAPYASVTVGDNAGENGYIHGDFGGPLDIPGLPDGLIGYRLNLAGQDGHTSMENQTVKRDLVSGAFDIHLPYDILVQLNAAQSRYQIDGVTPFFQTPLYPIPAPTNPATISSPSWTNWTTYQDTGGIKVTWKLSDIFTLRSAWDYTRQVVATGLTTSNTIENYSGTLFERSTYYNTPSTGFITNTNSGYAFLDATFSTFGI